MAFCQLDGASECDWSLLGQHRAADCGDEYPEYEDACQLLSDEVCAPDRRRGYGAFRLPHLADASGKAAVRRKRYDEEYNDHRRRRGRSHDYQGVSEQSVSESAYLLRH